MRRALALVLLLAACDGEEPMDAGVDAGAPDAGVDAGVDGGFDAGTMDAAPPAPSCEASGAPCDGTEYCDRGVGRCLGPGRCMARPAECGDPVEPVCGCDGVTYDSACEARRAGASIERAGAC